MADVNEMGKEEEDGAGVFGRFTGMFGQAIAFVKDRADSNLEIEQHSESEQQLVAQEIATAVDVKVETPKVEEPIINVIESP